MVPRCRPVTESDQVRLDSVMWIEFADGLDGEYERNRGVNILHVKSLNLTKFTSVRNIDSSCHFLYCHSCFAWIGTSLRDFGDYFTVTLIITVIKM